jgi:hypothetical protein
MSGGVRHQRLQAMRVPPSADSPIDRCRTPRHFDGGIGVAVAIGLSGSPILRWRAGRGIEPTAARKPSLDPSLGHRRGNGGGVSR